MTLVVPVQEFVDLKRISAGNQPMPGSSQEATGMSTKALTGSPPFPGDSRHAGSLNNEELHEQQAVLNQLKEVPIKSMNASLLVAPLLDCGEHTYELQQMLGMPASLMQFGLRDAMQINRIAMSVTSMSRLMLQNELV